MTKRTKVGAKSWFGLGVTAGIVFGVFQIIAVAVMGLPLITPFRMAASVLLGSGAIDAAGGGVAFIVGTIVHLLLSGLFGLLYGAINQRLARETQLSMGRQIGVGLLFAAALWLVNFQLVGRILYPWFLDTPQFGQMLMHAIFFGLPLGVMYAKAADQLAARPVDSERRPPRAPPPRPRDTRDIDRHPPGP